MLTCTDALAVRKVMDDFFSRTAPLQRGVHRLHGLLVWFKKSYVSRGGLSNFFREVKAEQPGGISSCQLIL
jgi:hypothetical protein